MHKRLQPSDKDRVLIFALIERLKNYRLPRTLELKERVDRGECLTETDIEFLKTAISEGDEPRRLANKYPEYRKLVNQMARLYSEIVRKDLENEENAIKNGTRISGDERWRE